jgi:hypothetical protein
MDLIDKSKLIDDFNEKNEIKVAKRDLSDLDINDQLESIRR